MLSRGQAGPLPAVPSNQARHQVHGKVWKDPQHSQGKLWLQGIVFFLSSFGTFLQLLFWFSTLPNEWKEQAGLVGVDDGFGGLYRADGGGLNLLLEELHY